MSNILIDTDILINFLRGREKARNYLLSVLEDSTIYCSVITVAEIYAGMKEHEKSKTSELIESLNVAADHSVSFVLKSTIKIGD